MPESHWKPSFPLEMDSLQFEIIPKESSFELDNGSMELSIACIAALPEISIPPPLFDPLPLQCLAASALPDGIKREIESVTASVIDGSLTSESIEPEIEDQCLVRTGGVPSVDTTEKRLVLVRDAVQAELVNDLGIGIRITGGVKCWSCGILHAVVTEVNRNSTHSSEICEGMCVVEWCGESLLGATFEQTTKILGSTRGESVEIVVKECEGRRQSKDSNRACNMFLDFTALSANVRTLTRDPSSKEEQTDILAVPERDTVSLDRSKISRSVSSHFVSETNPSPLTKLSSRPFSEVMEAEESPINEVSLPLLPKTLTIFPEDSFDDFFASLPSGMIRLSLTYDEEQERLRIILSQVKAQSSREVNDSSNVFINAYLIPDLRSQGAKFTKAALTPSDIQSAPIYNIKKNEIDSAALRVVLWEAPKKGSAAFRGEVLLRLSDNEIVNLDGDPTWYTVCPEDPNLPPVPVPITHRGKQRERVEQLFIRFKQTLNHGPTQALSYLKQHTSKASVSGGENISLDSSSSNDLSSPRSGSTSSLPSMRRRGSAPGKKRHRDRFGTMPRRPLLRLGKNQEAAQHKASVDNSATSIHEESERLSKMISILQVLQEQDGYLGFTIDSDPAEEAKKTRLQSILTVLKEPEASKSSPVATDSPDLHVPNNESDFSTLDRRNRKRAPKPAASTSKPSPKPQKAESDDSPDSLPVPGTVPTISTSEEMDGTQSSSPEPDSFPMQDSPTSKEQDESSPAIDPNRDSFSTIPDLRGSLGKTVHNVTVYSFLSESDASRHSQNTQEEEDTSSGQQQHYQLVDKHQTDDELDDKCDDVTANPSNGVESSNASKKNVTRTDSDCSCYSVNVNIGKQEERAPKTDRFSPSTLNPPVLQLTNESDWVSTKRKSRSVGDILDLDSDDEVPFEQSPDLNAIKGCHTLAEESDRGEHLPDVEFETRRQGSLNLPPTRPPAARSSGKGRAGSLFSKMPWAKKKGARKHPLRSKWASLDNIIEAVASSRSKKEVRPTSGGSWSENGKTPGSVSLELCYDLQHPLLTVSLVDVAFLPTKGLASDVTVKAQLFHNSTCLQKRKANISLKKSTAPSPLASFQFEADITNMALQVSLVNGSRLFSKKNSGQVWIDLNALQLQQNQQCSQWFQFSKPSIV